jgi:hypothetical protein
VMPLYPGDVISSGTPGAAVIADGDTAECRIAGIGVLSNPVVHGGRGDGNRVADGSPASGSPASGSPDAGEPALGDPPSA